MHDSETIEENRYIRLLSSSKIWFATTEKGGHVSPRFYEVMSSGRAMLLCDRNEVRGGGVGWGLPGWDWLGRLVFGLRTVGKLVRTEGL